MKKIIWLIFLMVLATGCSKGVLTMKERLEKFEKILPSEIRTAFDAGNYQQTIKLMEKEYEKNQQFKVLLDKVKDDEAINLFTIKEVVEFYRDYFVKPKKKP